mgnify:CR=1 FL=1
MAQNAGNKGPKITASQFRKKILEAINNEWPVHPSGVCRLLEMPQTVTNISKVCYHFKILSKENKINLKKIDRALTAWPKDIERLRIMHEFLKED